MDFEELKFGIEPPSNSWGLIKEITLICENSGYDSLWIPDHLANFGIRRFDALEAWSLASALSVLTKKIRIGTGVSDTYRHHPAVLAQMAVTCDVVSNGRAFLGIGIGEAMNLVPYGINYDKAVGKTREAVTIIRKLLKEDDVTFEGKYYRLKNAFVQPKPLQENLPIYIAANSPKTLKMAGELGDGWIPASMTPREYKEKLKELRSIAKKAGRSKEEIEPGLFTYCVIERSYESALKLAKIPVKMYLLSRPRILEELGYDPPSYDFEATFKLTMNKENAKKLLEAAKQVPDEAVEKSPVIIGDPDTVIKKIEEFAKAGVKHFAMCFFVNPDRLRETCLYFADSVIRYFKG